MQANAECLTMALLAFVSIIVKEKRAKLQGFGNCQKMK